MFKWLKEILSKTKQTDLKGTIGYNLKKVSDGEYWEYSSECMWCGDRWALVKNRYITVKHYQRCSKCLDITQIDYDKVTINPVKGIEIEGLSEDG